jgi:hypothetical protein
MNETENEQQANQPSEAIEDLTVKEGDAEEVKGGPNWPSVKMLDSVIGVDTDVAPNPDLRTGYDAGAKKF